MRGGFFFDYCKIIITLIKFDLYLIYARYMQPISTLTTVTPPQSPERPVDQKALAYTAFEELSSPEKNYRVQTKKGIRNIRVLLSPSVKSKSEALYRFKRLSDGKCLVGTTTRPIQKRVYRYHHDFRHPEKDAGKLPLPRAIQKNAKRTKQGKEKEDFVFGVVCTKQDLPEELQHLSMGALEKLYVDFKKEQGTELFNVRSGGGGGLGKSATSSAAPLSPLVETIRENYITPEKSYPLNPDNYRFQMTPSTKEVQDAGSLYVIKRIVHNAPDSPTTQRYVGKTERCVKKRATEHSSYARHPEKERGKKPLYRDMRNHPEEFSLKVFDLNQLGDVDIDRAEKGLIRFFKEEGEPLYNRNGGGGGGHRYQ